jgi:hypothetical protein
VLFTENLVIRFHHFKRGALVGLPIGIAIAISSTNNSGSIIRGVVTGLACAILAGIFQGLIESRAETKRQRLGMKLASPPVRVKQTLECAVPPESLIVLCRAMLNEGFFRVKKIEAVEPCRIVMITKMSFLSMSERITFEAKAGSIRDTAVLEISSVPTWETTTVDGGKNYANVFLLSKAVRERLGPGSVTDRQLLDLETNKVVQ